MKIVNIICALYDVWMYEYLISIQRVEYISVASSKDMKELPRYDAGGQEDAGAVLSSAVRLGAVRLIDNVLVGKAENNIIYDFKSLEK